MEGMYTQCELKKGNMSHVAWIPSKYAKIGKVLNVEGQDGWEVINCYSMLDLGDWSYKNECGYNGIEV